MHEADQFWAKDNHSVYPKFTPGFAAAVGISWL
jgi:hypothetical protein